MNKTIHIREAVTPEEVERFWQELHAYHARDVFPDPAEEDRAYFLDDSQYRAAVQRIHDREGDRCYYLLFRREGRDIGFALTALYPSEDGKCFVMEFCVLPEFRGGGTGTACARLLLDWAADRGAQYGELNAADLRRRKIDFIISNNSKTKYKIYPIEVKSGMRYTTESLHRFREKFKNRIGGSYIVHPRNLIEKDDVLCIPPYMVICL